MQTNGSVPNVTMQANGSVRNEKKTTVVVFEARKPFVSDLYERDCNVRSACQVAFTSAIFCMLSIIISDSIKAGRFHWQAFSFLAIPSIDSLLAAICIDVCYHTIMIAVYLIFILWVGMRNVQYFKRIVDVSFAVVYTFIVVSSFAFNIWMTPYFGFPGYICVTLSVEQLRMCMKSYSFIRENAYKVLYPWHKDDTSGPAVWYRGQMSPTVGSFSQYCYFLFAPTLLYRDHYPRSKGHVNWKKVVINLSFFIGGLMIAYQIYYTAQISDFKLSSILLSYVSTLPMSLVMLSMGTTSTMHGWMNMWAELIRFGDRQYYEDWWVCSTFQEFYRKWNIIPYHFNHQYLYKDMRKVIKSPFVAIFILILASSLIHEYIISITMGFFLPVLTVLFAGMGVFVIVCNLGSYYILLSLFTGSHMMMWSYIVEANARRICNRNETLTDLVYPRMIECFMKYN